MSSLCKGLSLTAYPAWETNFKGSWPRLVGESEPARAAAGGRKPGGRRLEEACGQTSEQENTQGSHVSEGLGREGV